jgi:hypothetical protein
MNKGGRLFTLSSYFVLISYLLCSVSPLFSIFSLISFIS